MKKLIQLAPIAVLVVCLSCKERKKVTVQKPKDVQKELRFKSITIADSVNLLWAHAPIDVTNDGLADLVFIDNNGYGGKLGYYEGQKENTTWKKVLIDDSDQHAMGDIEASDIDGDGDIDIVAAKHTGEWESAAEPSEVFWYENPSWQAHRIGEAPNFIKDVSIADFNSDGKMDIATLNFEENTLRIFQQNAADDWQMAQEFKSYGNLHEGMHTGDVNGDGFIDIVAGGHIFYCPGEDLNSTWRAENIAEKWNNQTGDWSRNGTKIFLRDLNRDGKSEVFISHSERSGYPLAFYTKMEKGWQEAIIADSIAACHTLQVFDFDLDGDLDVLAGVNKSRGEGLGYTTFPITIYLADAQYSTWRPRVISEEGIYNGQAVDYDGDGDIDIFRYQTHDAPTYQLLINQIND